MRVDDRITVTMEYVAEREQLKRSALSCPGLPDDIHMTRTVVAEHAELVVDTTEVGNTEGRYIFVNRVVTGNNR